MKKIWLFLSCVSYVMASSQARSVQGRVDLDRQGKHLSVNCSDERVIIEWDKFSIAKDEVVKFSQPSSRSIALNRVTGKESSQLLGHLKADGKLILINPKGITIGKECVLDTASFIASTLDISNEMLDGKEKWVFQGDSKSVLINLGQIKSRDGDLVLLAHQIRNEGELLAPNGTIACGTGREIWLQLEGPQRLFIKTGCDDESIDNVGHIKAHQVELKSESPYAYAVKSSGSIEAVSCRKEKGRVYLIGSAGGVSLQGSVLSESGYVEVIGNETQLGEKATIDVSGPYAGGTVLIGGEPYGNHSALTASEKTDVAKGACIRADATKEGDGGRVIVWSDGSTFMEGEVFVRGGPNGGNGGFVEASGLKKIQYLGRSDRTAPRGEAGLLLLDPESDITINAAGPTSGGAFAGSSPITFTPSATSPVISTGDLVSELALGNVAILTNGPSVTPAGSGTITIDDPITWSNATNLTLTAGRSITVNANVTNTSSGSITMNANNTITSLSGSFTGITIDGATLETESGDIVLFGTSGNQAGNIGISLLNGATLTSVSGDIDISGSSKGTLTNCAGVLINSSTISITGTGLPAGQITINGAGAPNGTDSDIGVLIENNASILSSFGDVHITGQAVGTGEQCHGIQVSDGTIQLTSTANLTMTGTGSQSSVSDQNHGIFLSNSAVVSVEEGSLTCTGTPGAGNETNGIYVLSSTINITGTGDGLPVSTLTGSSNQPSISSTGIQFNGGTLTTQSAPVNIIGTMDNSNAEFPTAVWFTNSSTITTNLGGDLLIRGKCNGKVDSVGIYVDNSTITTNSTGSVTLTTLAPTTTGTGNVGINLNNSALIESTAATAGAGSIILLGRGGEGTANCQGVSLQGSSTITSVTGPIDITGLGQADQGILVSSSTISSTGVSSSAATISLSGTGGSLKNEGIGVYLSGAGSVQSEKGAITIYGFGGTLDDRNYGIYLDGSVQNIHSLDDAPITLIGHGGVGTSNNFGIALNGGGILTLDGDVALQGFGAGTGTDNHGVSIYATTNSTIVSTGTGAISVIGYNSESGSNAYGINLTTGASILSQGTGNLTVRGTARDSSSVSAGIQISDTSTQISANSGHLTLVGTASGRTGIFVTTFGSVNNISGNITLQSADHIALENAGGINNGSGTLSITTGEDLLITASSSGAFGTGIFLTDGPSFFSIDGDLTLSGSNINGAYAQIGANSGSASAPMTFTAVGGNVTLQAQNIGSYALIGHGSPSLVSPVLSGEIDFQNVRGQVSLLAANSGAGSQGFAQIGHLDSTGSTLSGDIYISSNRTVRLRGGLQDNSAYARIGHGGQGFNPVVGPSDVLVKAGIDVSILSLVGDAAIVNLNGPLTLVVDNLYPTPFEHGSGRLVFGSTLQATGELRIYTSEQSLNIISGPINGEDYVAGTPGVDNPQEQFAVYFPEGSYSSAAFRLYYKVPAFTPDQVNRFVYDFTVAQAQLNDLLPIFSMKRIPGPVSYHADFCTLDEEGFNCQGMIDAYRSFYFFKDQLYWFYN